MRRGSSSRVTAQHLYLLALGATSYISYIRIRNLILVKTHYHFIPTAAMGSLMFFLSLSDAVARAAALHNDAFGFFVFSRHVYEARVLAFHRVALALIHFVVLESVPLSLGCA